MMQGLPITTGVFRAAYDPELRFTPSGDAVCSIRAVANSRKNNGTKENPEWVDDKTLWVKITGWRRTAENMAESFEKNSLMLVTGRMHGDEWEDNDGNKRTTMVITVDTIGPAIDWDPAVTRKIERKSGGQTKEAANESPWGPDSDDPPF